MTTKEEFDLATSLKAKAFPDRRYGDKRYWYRLGRFDLWRHDHAELLSGEPCWVVAQRIAQNEWRDHARFKSLQEAFKAITDDDWSAAEYQMAHLRHPSLARKVLVNIRLTQDEYYQLKRLASPRTMSDYIRELALSKQ